MHCYSLRFRKSPHFKNYGSFAAFVVSMFDVILVHLSVCRHKGTRSIWRWQLNVFSIEQSHFWLLRSGSIATRREKLKFKLSSQLNWSPHQKGIQNSLLAWFWILRRGFRIQGIGFQSPSMELGVWNPIISRIPDFLSCIPDSFGLMGYWLRAHSGSRNNC